MHQRAEITGFFRNRQQAFWVLQFGGWLAYGFIRMFQGLALGYRPDYVLVASTAATLGFLLTLGLRPIYRTVRAASPARLLGTALVSCIVAALIISPIETVVYIRFYDPSYRIVPLWYFGNVMLEASVLIAWSALYFGINYYEQLQMAREQALKATAMAHQAQLKMLRYQLNPHFLFNTLNAISTLVLDKNTKDADGMLGRLSSFLRYTLVNQPTQKVSLDQELYALGLYLDIEKVRFQERLKLDWDIADETKGALMPSLLLQPLIENAIKYAIAASEDGGMIAISARRNGARLELKVRDSGPGISGEAAANPALSSGVGIANTRARLEQIYGDNHAFSHRNIKAGGLEVSISIPYETSDDDAEHAE